MTSGLSGRRIVVTRPPGQASALVDAIERAGGEALRVPLIEIVDAPDGGTELRRAAADLDRFAWVVVASANAADRLVDASPPEMRPSRLAAVGPATAGRLVAAGWPVSLVPDDHRAEGLVDAFPSSPDTGSRRVLLPQPAGARPVLADGLRAKGWTVDVVEAYRTRTTELGPVDLERLRTADIVTFTSSSTVTSFVSAIGIDAPMPAIACIGPVTAATAAEAGLVVDVVADDHTVDGLVDAVEHFAGR